MSLYTLHHLPLPSVFTASSYAGHRFQPSQRKTLMFLDLTKMVYYMLVFQISHDFQLYILVAKTFLHPWCNFPWYSVGWMQSWKNLDIVLNLKSSNANNPDVMQNEFFTIKVTNFKDILNLENCQHYLDEIDVNYDGCDL